MNQSTLTLQALERWIATNRTRSPRLEVEADCRLGRLLPLAGQPLDALLNTPLTLGLYGHSTEGKHHLLSTLLCEDGNWPGVQLGDKTLNYLLHINPGVSPLMAVRFTHTPLPQSENYPLLLELFNESELAIKLMRRYHARADKRAITASDISARIDALRPYRLTQPAPGMTRHQFATVLQEWRTLLCNDEGPDDGLLYQMAELAESLSIHDRASLLGLLWGEDPAVTAAWEALALTLAQTGHAGSVMAPASLLVDNFMLPAEGFLFPAPADVEIHDEDVLVCPLHDGVVQQHVSISRQRLANLCLCVNLSLSERATAGEIDIIDIPLGELDTFARRLLPDTLLLCNPASDRSSITQTATQLADWLDRTQGRSDSALPRLVWAITPFDRRFSDKVHLDDGVQRLLSRAGKHWGLLQAMDHRNLFRLREWLADALSPASREQRFAGLERACHVRLHAQVADLLAPEISTAKEVEILVRGLQSQAAHFGELTGLLTLSRNTLKQCGLQFQQKPAQTLTPGLELDLFASDSVIATAPKNDSRFAALIFQRWVNHVHQLSEEPQILARLDIPVERLRGLCEVIIATAYHQGLNKQLELALAPYESDRARGQICAANVLSDFISWLGYQHTPPAQRPASKVNLGKAVFEPATQASASQRLTSLGEEPFTGHIRYIYDWLVALYHRGLEHTAQTQSDIQEPQRLALQKILKASPIHHA